MALTISTGFVVDDAIVMIENIARYIEQGDSPLEAALKGSKQIGFTILSLTVSLIAVLIPLLFMGDVVGRLFREFAITLGVTILISAVVSLTLTPMMCARLLKHTPEEQQKTILPGLAADVRPDHRSLRQDSAMGAASIRRRRSSWRWQRLSSRSSSMSSSPRAFSRPGHGAYPGISEAPQWMSFTAMAERPAGPRAGDPPGPGRREPVLLHRGGRDQHHPEQRADPHQPEAALESEDASASEMIRRLQPELAEVEGSTLFMQPCRTSRSRAASAARSSSTASRIPNAEELSIWAPKLVDALRRAAGASRREQRPAGPGTAGCWSRSTAPRPRGSGSRPR